MIPSTNQVLHDFYQGEAVTYQLTGSDPTDPTAWTVLFTLTPQNLNGPAIVVQSINIGRLTTYAGGMYTTVFSIPIGVGLTTPFPLAAQNPWQLERTDPGFERIMADGTVECLAGKAAPLV